MIVYDLLIDWLILISLQHNLESEQSPYAITNTDGNSQLDVDLFMGSVYDIYLFIANVDGSQFFSKPVFLYSRGWEFGNAFFHLDFNHVIYFNFWIHTRDTILFCRYS